jgi:CheY-like chemotaxis protein
MAGQMVVENLLEPLGYEIETCMNGIEAMEYLRTCSKLPNLVLLDVALRQPAAHLSSIR